MYIDIDEELVYRSAPCNRVKVCFDLGCDHVAPMRDQQACKKHPKMPLRKTNTTESKCPVQFAKKIIQMISAAGFLYLCVNKRKTQVTCTVMQFMEHHIYFPQPEYC